MRTCEVCEQPKGTTLKTLNTVDVRFSWMDVRHKVHVCDECLNRVPSLKQAMIAGMRTFQQEAPMPDREGPKATLICEGCKHDRRTGCVVCCRDTNDGTPADCPKMEEIPLMNPQPRVYGHCVRVGGWELLPSEAEALATALLIAAQKARQT